MGTPAGCRCEIVGPLGLGAVLSDGETVRAVSGAAYAVRRCPLCASAPDLLAALEAIWLRCSLGPLAVPRAGDTPERRQEIALYNRAAGAGEMARKAILAATGQEPDAAAIRKATPQENG